LASAGPAVGRRGDGFRGGVTRPGGPRAIRERNTESVAGVVSEAEGPWGEDTRVRPRLVTRETLRGKSQDPRDLALPSVGAAPSPRWGVFQSHR
jgi:hypothetical protein